jgi:L-fuconolactonase
MKIDAHQHFWDYAANAADYVWMSDVEHMLRRNFLPADLAPLLTQAGFDGTVAVQAREMREETDWLLGLASEYDFIHWVVGWMDLTDPAVDAQLEAYADQAKLKGLRMLIHDQPDTDFADSPAHLRGVAKLEACGLSYDLLLRTIHLPAAMRLVDALPNQRFVVDHIAKPKFDGSDWDAWSAGMKAMAERPNVMCKLSGLVTLADWPAWREQPYARFLDHVLDCFGPARCMIGSDWPVATCATDYGDTMGVVEQWVKPLSASEKVGILGANCAEFYGPGGMISLDTVNRDIAT